MPLFHFCKSTQPFAIDLWWRNLDLWQWQKLLSEFVTDLWPSTEPRTIRYTLLLHYIYLSIYLYISRCPSFHVIAIPEGEKKNIPDKKRLYGTFFFGVYPIDFWKAGKKIIRLSIKYRMSSGFPPDICHPDNKFYVDRESLSQVGLNISGLNYQFVYLYAFMSTGKVYLMWDLRFQGLDICMLLCRLGKFISSWT